MRKEIVCEKNTLVKIIMLSEIYDMIKRKKREKKEVSIKKKIIIVKSRRVKKDSGR